MLTEDQIKEYFEKAETDILFEKFISLLENDNDIVYAPHGLFNKKILKDTGRVTKKKGNIYIEINRPGFYDILPLGLFHNKIDELNTQPQYIEQVEAEKRTFRNLFLPFDSEIFSTSAKIERECNNHFKYTLDAEISVSLMKFFRIFDELDLLSVYEILFVDCIYAEKNRNIEMDASGLINSIFHGKSSPHAIMVKMLDIAQSDSKLKRFLNVLALATGDVGNLPGIEKIFRYIFNKEFQIEKVSKREKHYSRNKSNRIGGTSMNANANSLVIGDFIEDENEIVEVAIIHDTENAVLQRQYIDGCFHGLLRLVLTFFLSYDTDFQVNFKSHLSERDDDNQLFNLYAGYGKGFDTLRLRRKEIQGAMRKISPYEDSFYTHLDEDTRFRLKDYFTKYYAESVGSDANYSFLSMNTKI